MVPQNKLEAFRILTYSWGPVLKPKNSKKKNNGRRK